MNKLIKKVLTKIEASGFEAYIIGGYVRDLLLGKNSLDIDICTNATPKDLIKIFPVASTKSLGGIEFKIKEYHFEITTYREELKYKDRKPIEFNYINSLVADLNRRDFTINTICMNSKGEIIDLLNGIKELNNSEIKMIGDIPSKIKEDPLRILRAIRFAAVLNFNLESNLYKALKKYNKLVITLSKNRIKEELDKIFLSPYLKKGLNLLNELGILKLLNIKYNNNIIPVKNIEGIYAQLKFECDLPFTKQEKSNINALTKIINEKEITKFTIYKYGLYLSTIAGEILNVNKKEINKMYRNLAIKDKKDIDIKPEEIIAILGENYTRKIRAIQNKLEQLIINGKLKNKKSEIIKYLLSTERSD